MIDIDTLLLFKKDFMDIRQLEKDYLINLWKFNYNKMIYRGYNKHKKENKVSPNMEMANRGL